MFLYKPNIFEKEKSIAIGYSLVGFSLLMNGCEAGVEEKLRSTARPSSLNLMLYINAWSSVFLITAVAVTGEFPDFFAYCLQNPIMTYKIALACIVGGLGQLFSTSMIINFGVVPCCLVLTVRKFFNVLFSVLYFGHFLELRQWLAIVLIFTTLMVDAILSFVPNKKGDENKNECDVEKDIKDSEKQDKIVSLP